ncbi:PEST proteolytic signal containing nuclear [Trichuris trichiura]|uniref:PEST proteolytic signal-containing nuclear protein n=1 Tax=Trichuris trichiura TaxID=36087 RepID=A0A077Z4M1_TRITR|nr:PEST proteolytic signal containing nuclear [Trichuris trichiura]
MSGKAASTVDVKRKQKGEDSSNAEAREAKGPDKRIRLTLKPLAKPHDAGVARQEGSSVNAQNKPLPPKPSIFGDSSDSEKEEMPPECRMRMRNLGRDTPTSSGPNSFSKGKHGFIDSRKLAERKLHMMAREGNS